MVFTRMLPDGGGGGGGMAPDKVVDEARDVKALLDDIRVLARQVDSALQAAGEGTAGARRPVDLGSPSDQVAQGTVHVATVAQDVYRESVQYVLDTVEAYLEALLAAARQYAQTDESVEEGLRVFADQVGPVSTGSTWNEGQAANGENGYSGAGSGDGSGTSGGTGSDGSGSDGSGDGAPGDSGGTGGTDGGTGS